MHQRKIVALAFIAAQLIWTPSAFAQRTIEQREEDFQTCIALMEPRVGYDAAVAYCYDQHYGSDQTGGGDPGEYGPYQPSQNCYGQQAPCNPNVRQN